ncbi:DUF4328 domain-containing protein [Streptomyces sp. HU2014]|uniref:DUF4328 domain-containing protein n=1 Tax=Streptomyces sp. HU2014 TaxID=2939414 RepID=UPI00200F1C0E|nr:DUF4328 domain-containing protein [Streptomyces sp. HU2014]UQI48345.1 DUF4328 domain-containing protein [Streptomyces sp. HU2014]
MHRSGRCDACEGARPGIPRGGAGPAGGAYPAGGAQPVTGPESPYGPGTGPAPYPQGPAPFRAPPPGPGARLASPDGLARATVVLLVLCAVTDAVAVWSDISMFRLMDRVLADGVETVADADLDRADLTQAVTGFAQSAAYVAAAVLFVLWFRRVRVNAEVFAPDGHRMARGWSVGGWFVPVVNLWFPKKIANDTWNASLPYGPEGAPRPASRAVMNAWWVMWLVTTALGWISTRVDALADTFEKIRSSSGVLIVADAVDIVAAVLAVCFVRRLTALQREKAAQGPVPSVPGVRV